jgi:hypothetical protein
MCDRFRQDAPQPAVRVAHQPQRASGNALPSAQSDFEFRLRKRLPRGDDIPPPVRGNVVLDSMPPTLVHLRKRKAVPDGLLMGKEAIGSRAKSLTRQNYMGSRGP